MRARDPARGQPGVYVLYKSGVGRDAAFNSALIMKPDVLTSSEINEVLNAKGSDFRNPGKGIGHGRNDGSVPQLDKLLGVEALKEHPQLGGIKPGVLPDLALGW